MFPQLILKSGRDRSIINRHPWVFSGAIKTYPEAENGDIISVHAIDGKLLGYGFYSAKSQISCRMFHMGEYNKTTFDAAYWETKLQKAVDLRLKLIDSKSTTCYRLLHAEGDFLPGIIADVYNEVVVIQVLIKGIEKIFKDLEAAFIKMGFKHIYLRQKENFGQIEGVGLPKGWRGEVLPQPMEVLENDLKFLVDVETGQKTGFFIDQRDNRALTQQFCKGKKVLNAFSYTGGFSVYALAGGATEVHSVDVSKDAVAKAIENVNLNFPTANHLGLVADCFEFLRSSNEKYDLIILDPPAFAKNAKAINNAARGYKDLNLLAFKKLNPGGMLFTYSCSQHISPDLFRKIVFGAAVDAAKEVRILRFLTQADDHPISIYHPEGEYLKGLVLQVDEG